MAVLPDFQPENASYARSANAYIGGMEEGQSMMARAQSMRLQQQQADQQKAEFIAKLPAIQAKAQADIVNAKASIDNAVTSSQLEAKAAAESVGAMKEFNDAIQYNAAYDVPTSDGTPEGDAAQAEAGKYATQATYETRVQKLSALRAKYAYMANLKEPGYQAFYKNITDALMQANDGAHANQKIEELLAVGNMRADATKYGSDQGVVKEQIKAGAKLDSAQIYTGSRERIAAINNDTKLTMQDKAAKINAEKQGAILSDLTAKAANADQEAADATAANDPRRAALAKQDAEYFRNKLQKETTFAQSPPAETTPIPAATPRPKAAPAATGPSPDISISIPGSSVPGADQGATATATAPTSPPAVAPTKIPKDAISVDIGGKTYPIFKDKHGNRAYKVDGHYVPIATE